MGYCISQGETQFHIKAAHKAAALAAVRRLARDERAMSRGSSQGDRWYSWVTTDDFYLAKTLEVALSAWRWDATIHGNTHDIVGLQFNGEKSGDDEVLFSAIAPFVTDGSYIQMSGEDGAVWRWVFKGATWRWVFKKGATC
jgi:hypothetical protein